MQDKRMRKLEGMRAEAFPPKLYGPENYADLVICWGSTIPIFREALSLLDLKETSLLAFEQLWPLHTSVADLLNRARTIVVAEGNSTAQFSRLLRAHTGIAATKTVLKYNGLPFSVEEAANRLSEVFSGKGGRV